MADESEGARGKPFELLVETGKIREFALATGSRDEAYAEADPVSPPTFLVTSEFWMRRENGPWGDRPPNFERLLHGGQEFVFHGPPPRAGTKLIGEARIDRRFEKHGKRGGTMTFVETVTDFRDAETLELLVEVRSTLIETSKAVVA